MVNYAVNELWVSSKALVLVRETPLLDVPWHLFNFAAFYNIDSDIVHFFELAKEIENASGVVDYVNLIVDLVSEAFVGDRFRFGVIESLDRSSYGAWNELSWKDVGSGKLKES